MTRYFVIGTDAMKPDQSDSIRKWAQAQTAWWHWIDGLWLIISTNDNMDVGSIRDKLRELAPGVSQLVLEVNPESWSGFGPKSENRNMFTWLNANWKK